jgi:TldD protein
VQRLRPTIWLATERAHRQSREAFAEVKAKLAVKAKEEEQSNDFSKEQPLEQINPAAVVKVDLEDWKARLRRLAAPFKAHPEVYFSQIKLMVSADNRYLINSEGSRVQTGRTYARVGIMAHTRAEDGMDLIRSETVDAGALDRLAAEEAIAAKVQQVITDLKALRKAPLTDPYIGPAILEGRAAGVYFHEIFGHRVEGHRQKGHLEGQTFAKQVGKQVLPPFIDVYDDPTITGMVGVELNGFYRVDDEGVVAQRASLVEGGILKGFLMSRDPARGFNRSNGHGRRQEGRPVVSRQGNLIVHPTRVTTPEALKARLLLEIKRQKKPYGLRFTVVQGGFTNTSRYGAQFFKVKPVMVYKIYPDGREELVRGADIEGTPLASISQVQLAANDMVVFNGYCGAESGMVPVSAASPSLLVSKVEIARRMTGKERPPILPAPPNSATKGGAK